MNNQSRQCSWLIGSDNNNKEGEEQVEKEENWDEQDEKIVT